MRANALFDKLIQSLLLLPEIFEPYIGRSRGLLQTCLLSALLILPMPFASAQVAAPGTIIPNVASASYLIPANASQGFNQSNQVDIHVLPSALIGIASTASQPYANVNETGAANGSATTRISLRVLNYGNQPLYNVNIDDLLAGAGTDRWGAYVSNAVAQPGQYTIVAGSARLLNMKGDRDTLKLSGNFTGEPGRSRWLTDGAVLEGGGEFTLQFDLQFHPGNDTGTRYHSAMVLASDQENGAVTQQNWSSNGIEPDANGDSNPSNDAAPTPIPLALPQLELSMLASPAVAGAQANTYQLNFKLKLSNQGSAAAHDLSIIKDLDCAFQSGALAAVVESWRLLAPPVSENGLLAASASYSGQGGSNCSEPFASGNANGRLQSPGQGDVPGTLTPQQIAALNLLTDKAVLQPGQSDTLQISVLVSLKPGASVTDATIASRAWAAAGHTGNGVRPSDFLATGNPSGDPASTAVTQAGARLPSQVAIVFSDATLSVNPFAVVAVTLEKHGSSDQAEQGDMLDFTLILRNGTARALSGVTIVDNLPPGMRYIPGSTRLRSGDITAAGKVSSQLTALKDPEGGVGPELRFTGEALELAALQNVSIVYRVRIGPGAPAFGELINRAQASSTNGMKSNLATWRLRVGGGVFSQDAFAFGKVFLDCNNDGLQNDAEAGIPGVRLILEDGTSVVTDVEGKWSLYGLRPVTHVLKLDNTTLPAGAKLAILSNRQAGVADSVFLDLKNGEWHKANFAVNNCAAPGLKEEVASRRQRIKERPQTEALAGQLNLRMEPRIQPVLRGQYGNLAASGQLMADGTVRADNQQQRALIDLPNNGSSGFNSANGAGAAVGANSAAVGLPAGPGRTDTLAAAVAGTGNAADKASGRVTEKALDKTAGNTAAAAATGLVTPAAKAGAATGAAANPNTNASTVANALNPASQGAKPTVAKLDLQEQVKSVKDNSLQFLDLQDGAISGSTQLNLRLKGPLPGELHLKVNGVPVPDNRIAGKAALEARQLWAIEYIGVVLKPGSNLLEAESTDQHGNVRERIKLTVRAPGAMARLQMEAPESARADGKTAVKVVVRITDEAGLPVHERGQLTLENNAGVWNVQDQSNIEPGIQTMIEGGVAELEYIPPERPGNGRLQASINRLVATRDMIFLPDLRPLTGIGIVEGVIDLSRRGKIELGSNAANAFESELGNPSTDAGDARVAARTAMYFHGAILGEYLLSAAYDSDKQNAREMLRDIRPDQFYPVYGDSSVKSFDAQSSGKLYVRIDKNRSFLLYGDFMTASSQEVRQLSQINRAVNGLRHQYENADLRMTSYASRDTLRQKVLEFPANGTSGPFVLGARGEMILNTETVEILVRDANQMNLVLKTKPMTRFVDYTIEPVSKTLLFTAPVSSYDPDGNLNPQSIRVSYSVDGGGDPYWVAGSDLQLRVSDQLQLGAVAHVDEDPENQRKLAAFTALAKLDDKTVLAAELVGTESDLKQSGSAARVEIKREDRDSRLHAQLSHTSTGFDNPNASSAAGQTNASLRMEYRINEQTQLKGEAIYNQSRADGSNTDMKGVSLAVQRKLNEHLTGEIGIRSGQQNSGSAAAFNFASVSGGGFGSDVGGSTAAIGGGISNGSLNFTSLRGRLTSQLPMWPGAEVFIDAEQALQQADKRALSIGGSYLINDKARVYGRYGLISSLYDNPYDANTYNGIQKNVGLLGVETSYMEGGRFFNEYRMVDTIDGRGAQAATGVRNTFSISDNLRANAGVEHTGALGGVNGLRSTAYTGSLEYRPHERLRSAASLELRDGSDTDSKLASAGMALKLDSDWSLLARAVASDVSSARDGANTVYVRQQIGFAYRPVDQDLWNLIGRYEHRKEEQQGQPDNNYFTEAHIVSLHANYQPRREAVYSARYAAKWGLLDRDGLSSSSFTQLLMGRASLDLNAKWDIGLQAGISWSRDGVSQKVVGAEAGYQLMPNLWLSGGYNWLGLSEPDLGGPYFTSQGPYVRMRFKFDENTLKPRSNTEPVPLVPATP